MTQLKTVTRSYSSFEDARNVVVRLVNAGIPPDTIGLLGRQSGGEDNTAAGAGVGGAAGAATGFVIGLGAVTMPGVGPIIAAGWLLSGAVMGALAGGILGALVDAGVPQSEAQRYENEHRSGRSVVSVRVDGPNVAVVTAIMDAAMPIEPQPDEDISRADDLSKAVS